MDIRRHGALSGDNRQLRCRANLHRDPSHGSLAPNLEVTGHSLKNSSLTCSGNTLPRAISRTALKRASQGASTIKWLLWQQLVRFTQIQCYWLRPGGTPGSNILIKLICEILTMWVFRWLVIWCERNLCFHWKGTGEAGTCFGETLQKIIAVELSWVRAITNDSVCLPPHESQILHYLFLFFLPAFADGLSNYFFPRPSSFVSNLLRMIHDSNQLDYNNVSFSENEKVGAASARCSFLLVPPAHETENCRHH